MPELSSISLFACCHTSMKKASYLLMLGNTEYQPILVVDHIIDIQVILELITFHSHFLICMFHIRTHAKP